jgi:spore coat polysaccharide biosynthesis predicted glycosyltransferase SpsG
MKKKALIYFDYDLRSGHGHISRTETFFEAINLNLYEVFLSSKTNPILFNLNLEFLKRTSWIDFETAKRMSFDFSYVDSYSQLILDQFKKVKARKKVILVDSNFNQELPSWADLAIILEQGVLSNQNCNIKQISGLTLIKNKVKIIEIRRRENYRFRQEHIKGIINFGGSNQSKKHLLKLEKAIIENPDVWYIMYCAPEVAKSLLVDFKFMSNLEIRDIDFSYYDELVVSDFLVTAPGTIFMESIYIRIPIVLFNIFNSTELNFSRFRHESNVLFSGESEALSTNWISSVLSRLTTMDHNVSTDMNQNFLGTSDLALALDNLIS